jgi:hypothetical protein
VQNGGTSADANHLTFRILHFGQEIFQEAGCAKQIVIHFAVTNHIEFIGVESEVGLQFFGSALSLHKSPPYKSM